MRNSCDTDDIRDLFYNPDLAIPYRYIQTKEELLPHVRKIMESKVIGLDTETTGLCPFRNTIRLIQVATGLNDPVLVIDLFKLRNCSSIFKELFFTDAVKVFHNTSFDWNMFKSHNIPIKGNIFDTMIAGQILDCGIHRRGFKLSDMMKKYLNVVISKEQQKSDWSRDDLTPSQLYYAAKDAYILLQLREVMKKKLIQENLVNIASIEFRAIPAVADITYNGIYLDKDKWKDLTNKHLEEEHILKAELIAFIGDGINLDSPVQLIKALTKKGINISDTNNESMVLALDRYPQLQTIINYRKVTKALTSFLYPMIEWVNPITNRIHSSYFQIGGRSGRFSCGSPNFQQIPRKREFRECFRAEFEDTTFVLSDFSQIELRVGAEISGDPVMIKAYQEGQDLHKLTASLISGKDMKDVTKEERQCGKPVNFGLIFGMSAPTLCNYSKMNYGVDMTVDEAYTYRNRYFSKYKGLLRWHVMQKYKAQKEKETVTLSGRKRRWLNTPSVTEVYNSPVQGTAVDIIKIAFTNILENLKNTSAKLIGSVHDKILSWINPLICEKPLKSSYHNRKHMFKCEGFKNSLNSRGFYCIIKSY